VIVRADRGRYAGWLGRCIVRLGWPPLLRLKSQQRQLRRTLLACGEEDDPDPWLLLTDMPPAASTRITVTAALGYQRRQGRATRLRVGRIFRRGWITLLVAVRRPAPLLRGALAKMQEYLDNGARLSWLIDPANRMVYVYRPNQPVERLENPATILGDPVLPGFIIALERI
jgi:Putative restriction endonuclease